MAPHYRSILNIDSWKFKIHYFDQLISVSLHFQCVIHIIELLKMKFVLMDVHSFDSDRVSSNKTFRCSRTEFRRWKVNKGAIVFLQEVRDSFYLNQKNFVGFYIPSDCVKRMCVKRQNSNSFSLLTS